MRLTAAALFLLLASPCYAADDAAPSDTFTVELERGETRTAVKVVPRSDGTVALTLTDGTTEYHQAAHVRSIRAADGTDWTEPVLRDRESLGTPRAVKKLKKPRKAEVYRASRFRPGPPSVCGGYCITENSLLWENGTGGDEVYVLFEYGYAKNVGKSHSVGGTFLFGVTNDVVQTGARLRLARWVSHDVNLNFSPGVIFAADHVSGTTDVVTPQLTAQAGVDVDGRFGFAVDMYRLHTRDHNVIGPPIEARETKWNMGIHVGSVPALITLLPALYLAAALQLTD